MKNTIHRTPEGATIPTASTVQEKTIVPITDSAAPVPVKSAAPVLVDSATLVPVDSALPSPVPPEKTNIGPPMDKAPISL